MMKRCGKQLLEKRWRSAGVYESAAQRSKSICHDCEKNGNNHGIFTTKVVMSVFVVFAMRGTISCTVTGRRRYSIDLYITLNLLPCTQKRKCYFHKVNYRCFNYCQ